MYCSAALVQLAREQQQQQQAASPSVVYPSSSVTYIDYWPDGAELSLLCAASRPAATLVVQWFKDAVLLASSDRLR